MSTRFVRISANAWVNPDHVAGVWASAAMYQHAIRGAEFHPEVTVYLTGTDYEVTWAVDTEGVYPTHVDAHRAAEAAAERLMRILADIATALVG